MTVVVAVVDLGVGEMHLGVLVAGQPGAGGPGQGQVGDGAGGGVAILQQGAQTAGVFPCAGCCVAMFRIEAGA